MNSLKQKYTPEQLIEIAHYHDAACNRMREPFNWDNPLCRKNYSYNRHLSFSYRELAREMIMEGDE